MFKAVNAKCLRRWALRALGPWLLGANWARAPREPLGPGPKGPTGPGPQGNPWARAPRGQLGPGPRGTRTKYFDPLRYVTPEIINYVNYKNNVVTWMGFPSRVREGRGDRGILQRGASKPPATQRAGGILVGEL